MKVLEKLENPESLSIMRSIVRMVCCLENLASMQPCQQSQCYKTWGCGDNIPGKSEGAQEISIIFQL